MGMKLSELKKQIKDNVYEILSEESVEEGTYVGAGAIDALQKDPKFAAAKDKTTPLNTLKTGGSVTLEEESIEKYKVGDILSFKDGEEWKVMKVKDNVGKLVIKPNNEKAKEGNVSLEIDVDLDYLKKNLKESEDEDREPTKAELAKEKVKTVSKFKIPTDQFEDFKSKLKTLVTKVKAMEKGDERTKKMAALKQFIKKPELMKAFKERDVKIDTGGLIG
jgi:hypothetical protein